MKISIAAIAGCLVVALVAACGGPDRSSQLPEELLMRKATYDTSHSWRELVKPHFFARSQNGDVAAIEGSPEMVVERDGMVKVRLATGDGEKRYVDLLALQSERIGEHPVHKVFRLNAMGVPAARDLLRRLRPTDFRDDLFHTLQFQYLPGSESSGVIAEVFPDGTFLVIPFGAQPEWESDRTDVAAPTHFHVDPRALSVKDSPLAAEYEKEILALPFDDQRYPAAPLARKQCGVYTESLQNKRYTDVLASVGYDFTPSHVVPNRSGEPASFSEELIQILREGSGEGVVYLGFGSRWVAALLAELQVEWVGECDGAYGLRPGPARGDAPTDYFIMLRRSLEPDKGDRYKILRIAADGSGRVIYDAPGIILLAVPLPFDPDQWILSTEGWTAPRNGSLADPRWQSVYVLDVNTPERYHIVKYPISQYPRAQEQGLYGSSPLLTDDSRFLINTLYGFEDEGGGLWIADLADDQFHGDPSAFARIVPWDHALSWIVLGSETLETSQSMSVMLTAKEVGDGTAMTMNLLRINRSGLDSRVELRKRLLRMVGWNPVPMAVQRLSEHRFWVAAETHFNYESSLLPRAKGVYFMPVDTSAPISDQGQGEAGE